jgi:hypothetical protein
MGSTFLPEFWAQDLVSYQLLSALESSSSSRVGELDCSVILQWLSVMLILELLVVFNPFTATSHNYIYSFPTVTLNDKSQMIIVL